MKIQFFSLVFLVCSSALAADNVMKDFDSLGGSSALMEKVKNIEPDKKLSIVQNRTVDRIQRAEVAPEFFGVLGGDSYLNTAGYGIVGQYHFNPSVSLGARYSKMSNQLSTEGKNLIDESIANGTNLVPDMDQPLNQALAFVNYYPVYGKLNLFNKAITQFDVYGSLGYGTINLKSGGKATWTAGGGIGFWLSQHLTTRLELLYQSYEAQRIQGSKAMNLTLANLQIGYLL